MSAFIRLLTRTPALIVSGLAMVLVGYSFSFVRAQMDGPLLDMIWTGGAAQARLAVMSAAERTAHFWGTVLIDTAFPLAYGAFLAGLAGRFAGENWRALAMLPAALVVVLDFAENAVQALALSGVVDLLGLKSLLTPAKFGLFYLAALLAFGLGLLALARWVLQRSAR